MKWKLIAFVLFVAACSDSDPSITDWEKAGLKGEVQKLIEEEYRAIKSEAGLERDELLSRSTYEYSQSGFVIKSTYEVPAYGYIEIYEYDNQGHPLKLIMRNGEEEVISECELELNKKGKVVNEIWRDAEGKQESAYKNNYNQKGQLVETKAFTETDSLRVVRRFSYNAEGLIDTASSFTPKGVLQNIVVKEYKNKWLVSSTNIMNRGEEKLIATKTSIRYSQIDDQGNWLIKRRKVENRMSNEVVYRIVGRQLQYYSES